MRVATNMTTTIYLSSPIVGGFGNQLFILAAAFNMKNLFSDMKLVFPKTTGTKLRPTYWDNFFTDCPRVQESLVSSLPKVTWRVCGNYSSSDEYCDISAVVEQNRQQGVSTSYQGYFQNWRYLPPKSFLLDLFNIPAKQSRVRDKVAAVVGSPLQLVENKTCSLHFRLGDYKGLTHVHPILPDSYYRNALKVVLSRNPDVDTLLVFNEIEDQKTVESRMVAIADGMNCQVRYANNFGLQDWEDAMLMSLCKANIVANSSFSWWASYFNQEERHATIVYPPQWSCGEKNPPEFSLALPGWIAVGNGSDSSPAIVVDPSPPARNEEICIDVGSHDGVDALRLQKSFSTKVYAFEPHPKFFELTARNTKFNRCIEVLPYAVSDATEKFIVLNESRGDQSHSILPFKSAEELNIAWAGCNAVHPSGRSFVVRMTRLDSFLDSRGYSPESLIIMHLHVDAQGVDLEVLRSLGEYLPSVKTGVVEVAKTAATSSYQGQQGTISSVTEFLQANGFVVDAVKPNDVTPEISREFNICFSRRET